MTALRRGIIIAALVLILAGVAGRFALLQVSADPDNTMALDATSGGAVDATRTVTVTVPGTEEFDIGVNIVAPVSPAYAGYQAIIRYDSAVINFVQVTVNEAGSTVALAAGDCNDTLDNDGDTNVDGDDAQCDRAGKNVNYLPVGGMTLLTVANDAAVSGSLRKTSTGASRGSGTTSFAGQMLIARYKCVANGTTQLHLIAQGEAAAFSGTKGLGGADQPTTLIDASITCEGLPETPTPTPTPTATATPVAPTNTATRTPTATNTPVAPTNTPTATETPVGPTNTPTVTETPVAPTNTATRTPTATNTPVGPTNTATRTPTATNTPVPPTNTATRTPTATNTPVGPTSTPGAGNAMAVDATSGGAVDATRTVTGPAPDEFDIGVNITAAPTAYAGYQAVIRYDSAVINFVPVTVNEAGSTVAIAAGDCNDTLDNDGDTNVDGDDAQCDRAGKNVNYLPVGGMTLLTVANDAAVSGSLRKTSTGASRGSGTTSFAGQMLIARYKCVANGTTQLHLIAQGEAAAFSGTKGLGGTDLPTTLTDATVTCEGFGGPTLTPTATGTPGATPTPTATGTPGATPTVGPTVSTYYFAEGFTGNGWLTFTSLMNPGGVAANVTATYYLDVGDPVVIHRVVPAGERKTIAAHEAPTNGVGPGLAFGTKVEADQPIIAQQALIDTVGGLGHGTIGTRELSTTWWFSEGVTAGWDTPPGWLTFTALMNPGDLDANVTATYYLDGGAPVVISRLVPAHQRRTLAALNPLDGPGAGWGFGTKIESSQPIVAQQVLIDLEGGLAHGTIGYPSLDGGDMLISQAAESPVVWAALGGGLLLFAVVSPRIKRWPSLIRRRRAS